MQSGEPNTNETTDPEPSASVRLEATEPKSLENLVKRAAIEALGKNVNWTGHPFRIRRVQTIKQFGGEDEGGYVAAIEYRPDENLTNGLTRMGIVSDAMELMQKLSTDPTLSNVKIYLLKPHMKLVDKYGRSSEEQVGKFKLQRAIAKRINWRNMTPERFEQILRTEGEFRLHRAFND